MAGTKTGGKAAAKTNTRKYGGDFYRRIGAIGGRKGTIGGFFANRELAREAGRKGGKISRRTKKTGYSDLASKITEPQSSNLGRRADDATDRFMNGA